MNQRLVLAVIVIFVAACADKKVPDAHDHPELTTAKQLFDFHCATCHGKSGKGKFIEGIPPNALTKKSSKTVIKKIRFGDKTGSVMPVFKNMPEDEAKLIVKHLFKLKQEILND